MSAPTASLHNNATEAPTPDSTVVPWPGSGDLGQRPSRTHNLPIATQLPLGVQAVAVIGYAAIFVILWITFGSDRGSAFMVGVSTFFALVFFGVPYLMDRVAQKHGQQTVPTLKEFLAGDFDTWTGRISGWEALIQVALVPVALAFGSLALATIIILSR